MADELGPEPEAGAAAEVPADPAPADAAEPGAAPADTAAAPADTAAAPVVPAPAPADTGPAVPADTTSSRRAAWVQENKSSLLVVGCVVLCGIIGLDLAIMLKEGRARPVASAEPAVAAPSPAASEPARASAPAPSSSADDSAAPEIDPALTGPEFADYSDDGEPRQPAPAAPKRYGTVQQAAVESCTTESVERLSRQIIAQARCLKPNSFVPLPSRPNLVIGSQVFPYLELEARDQLLKALDSKRSQKMTINSALRTVAQQYLVWRWSATKRCGVQLATTPGDSNHETGIALDIAEAGTWRPVLEKHNFRWLGSSDRVHFDYKPKMGQRSATDVLAFQTLWNRNNPKDQLKLTGRYDSATEERLKKSPADGFKLGPSCGK